MHLFLKKKTCYLLHLIYDSVVNIRHFVAYDAERNILIEPSQDGAIEVLTDRNNKPLILYTLGYKDIYEIVGLYKLVPKTARR